MNAINYIEIETKSGYRSFELHQGDISDLSYPIDLICISAYSKSYWPVPNTVISSLHNRGINVEQLAGNCLFDFRDSFGGWLSKQIDGNAYNYILCMEMKGTGFNLDDAVKNLFTILSILEFRRLKIKSVAIPLIGTGSQRYEPNQVIELLIDNASDFLEHARYLEKIVFVEGNENKVKELNEAMDNILGRSKVRTPRGPLVDGIKQEIIGDIDKITKIIGRNEIFNDLRRIILSPNSRAFEIGGVSRRFVEFIAQDLSPSKKLYDLWKKIETLSTIGIAQWIIEYMHVLRVFGNEAVHEKTRNNRNPKYVEEKDLELCLFCIQRILDFYHNIKKKS